jgi:hypothetical protein
MEEACSIGSSLFSGTSEGSYMCVAETIFVSEHDDIIQDVYL